MTKQVNMMMLCFNPRTHVGCDIVIDVPEETIFFVSIHAPTWGATSKQHRIYPLHGVSIHAPTWGATLITCSRLLMLKFQSTHPRGVRPKKLNLDSQTFLFQSTHPRGVRLCRSCIPFKLGCFNPRTHVGCD